MHKTKGMWLGSKAGQTTGPVDIQWINDKLKLLALTFGSEAAILASWQERVTKLETCLSRWQHRDLSLQGKTLILNTLGLSGQVYLGSVQPIPKTCLQSINTLIVKFLWSEKTEPINSTTLTLPKDRGGLGITDLEIKLLALHLKRLQSITCPLIEVKWVYFARYWTGRKLSRIHPAWSSLGADNKPHFDLLNPPPPPPPPPRRFTALSWST